ncbi:uncharacterized protein [Vulpes vulpes]|uniref:Uncharacterized protein isoform X9 n=1 Tax=Vulpes vulpes TaxID=9627 RepID=A0ABM4YEI0_VULVU
MLGFPDPGQGACGEPSGSPAGALWEMQVHPGSTPVSPEHCPCCASTASVPSVREPGAGQREEGPGSPLSSSSPTCVLWAALHPGGWPCPDQEGPVSLPQPWGRHLSCHHSQAAGSPLSWERTEAQLGPAIPSPSFQTAADPSSSHTLERTVGDSVQLHLTSSLSPNVREVEWSWQSESEKQQFLVSWKPDDSGPDWYELEGKFRSSLSLTEMAVLSIRNLSTEMSGWYTANVKFRTGKSQKEVFRLCVYGGLWDKACPRASGGHKGTQAWPLEPQDQFYFFHERHRERGRDIGRGRSRLPARSTTWDTILDPGSHPELKADAQPLNHPGVPI